MRRPARGLCRPAYATGIQCIDHRLLGGFQAGRFYGIAARHKAGKSLLLATIAYNIATSENRCGLVYLTLEMSPEEIWRRIVARHIGVNDAHLARAKEHGEPELIEKARLANGELRNRGLYFLGRPGCTLDELRTIVARAGMSDKINGVIVVYLQLLSGRPRGQSTAEFLDEAVPTGFVILPTDPGLPSPERQGRSVPSDALLQLLEEVFHQDQPANIGRCGSPQHHETLIVGTHVVNRMAAIGGQVSVQPEKDLLHPVGKRGSGGHLYSDEFPRQALEEESTPAVRPLRVAPTVN